MYKNEQEHSTKNATTGNPDVEKQWSQWMEDLEAYDFIRLVTPDLNGISLCKLVPARHSRRIMANQCEIYSGIIAFGPRFELTLMPEVIERKHQNSYLVPDMRTLHPCPWTQERASDVSQNQSHRLKRVASIICDMHWQDGTVLEAHPRIVARRLLRELEEKHQLKLYAGFEPEFRLFHSQGFWKACDKPNLHAEWRDTLLPVTRGDDMYRQVMITRLEPFLMKLDNFARTIGIDLEENIYEHGSAQVETPLMPQFGLDAADAYFNFKQVVRETANLFEMDASFMTAPLMQESSNGCHFNHSLWDLDGEHCVFYDPEDPNNLSKTARHWIGGIISHMPALIALCSPTVNCYRRLHRGWAPDHIDWDFNDRFVALRVKNMDETRTYMENRLASSASCPYHVMAATLAAGMDGLERELEPPPAGKRAAGDPNAVRLPDTLQEAIGALKADTILCERLGEQFIDWFIRMKEFGDLVTLLHVQMTESDEEMLAWERYEYLAFV